VRRDPPCGYPNVSAKPADRSLAPRQHHLRTKKPPALRHAVRAPLRPIQVAKTPREVCVRSINRSSRQRKPKPRDHFEQRPFEFFRSHSVSRAKPPLQVRGSARGTGKKQATSSNGYAARGTRDGGQLFGRQFLNFHPDKIRNTEQRNCTILNSPAPGPLLPLARTSKAGREHPNAFTTQVSTH
jgi:hypothetical protein